ncbi:MAG TPA: GspE/PulE family protein [Acidimicrobiales bacterium]|nr:GspE/PulE family protein [Acidimicrobiales bacterium]
MRLAVWDRSPSRSESSDPEGTGAPTTGALETTVAAAPVLPTTVVQTGTGGMGTGIPGRLGELLVNSHLITSDQLANALMSQAASGRRLGQLLVEEGIIGEADLLGVLADQMGLDLVDLGRNSPDKDAIAVVPESVARSHHVVPFTLDGETVELVTSQPGPQLASTLSQVLNRPVRLALAPAVQVQRAIDSSYRAVGAIGEIVAAFESSAPAAVADVSSVEVASAAEAPVVQVVNLMITQALRDRASDVHIEPQGDQIRIRFRIDGALHEIFDLPPSMGPALISRLKIMGGMNIVERRRPQDGQIAMEVDGRSIDIRVATVATIAGEKCVLRILDKSRPLYRLEDLGMPTDTYATFGQLIRAPFGMVICAGPTGSGKTTTLYGALTEINQPHRNITTVEDPVEYVFPSLNQIQINESAGLSFADGLKSILRQDPDVILVGEIRDAETARIAVQSSLTGHLVLSSFHATDTSAALHRLLDMGIESFLVASSVTAVVAQRLLRRICTSCRAPYTPTDEEMAFYREGDGPEKDIFWAGTGCNFCAGTGYRDRIGVYELMRVTPELRRLIVGWATQDEIRRAATAQGMRSLLYEGLRLVGSDVTTISEVIRGVYAGV